MTKQAIGNVLPMVFAIVVASCVGCSNSTKSVPATGVDDNDHEEAESAIPDGNVTAKAALVVENYLAFLDSQGVSDGAIAVSYQGELVSTAGKNRQADDNAPVASLSKAITAVCVIKAMTSNGIDPSATLVEVMPNTLADLEISDQRLLDVTIAQLLLHNSGIQTAHISALGTDIPTMRQEQKLWQLEFIAVDGLSADPGSGFEYANANYLILGIVIESVVAEDYETWCRREVLGPLGITRAGLSPSWAVLSAFGGWEISAVDYLKFVNANFKPDAMVGIDPSSTNLSIAVGQGARYGLGTVFRLQPSGAIYWHAGSFTWQSVQQSGRFGAYYAAYPNGFSVVVNLSDNLDGGRSVEIDRILFQLAEYVTITGDENGS